jgi:hypothetical protein
MLGVVVRSSATFELLGVLEGKLVLPAPASDEAQYRKRNLTLLPIFAG